MADVHDKATRSYNMSRIRSGNTKPEMLVRKFLHAQGFRYKLHDKTLPVSPTFVLPKYKTIIFIHGCFWHGHTNCKYYVVPKTRTAWWLHKINTNQANDAKAISILLYIKNLCLQGLFLFPIVYSYYIECNCNISC